MMFVLRMAWRETRASWARLLFFFLCVGLGVAAIIVLRSVVQNVRETMTREARSMVGADLVLQSQRPFTDAVLARFDTLLGRLAVSDTADLVETQTMASPPAGQGSGLVKLVELRGVETGFPFYGRIELADGGIFTHDLVANHGAVVQPELLVALGLESGDEIRLAGQSFVIRGVIARDRVQRSGGFALGPRIYIDLADLRRTSLLGYGSRASYQRLLKLDGEITDDDAERLRDELRRDFVSVRSWQRLEDRIGRNLTIAENYLSLVGFAIVVIGGIGVWSVTRVIVQQKIRSVAILKCLGARSSSVLGIYVLQVMGLAVGGSAIGLALSIATLMLVPPSMLEPLGIASVSVTPSAALQGAAVGVLVSLLFALVPLLEVRDVKPLLLLRADTATTARKRSWRSWLATLATGAALVVVAVWQADSITAGTYVSLGLAVVAAALYGASRGLIRATRSLTSSPTFAIRHAVISLSRPGNQTRVILMAVGLGCFFILSVRALQTNLLDNFAAEVGESSPDLVLIDVQRDQVQPIEALVRPSLRAPARIVPLLRARVVGVDGRRTRLANADEVREQGRIAREFGLTFRNRLEPNETLTDGELWSRDVGGEPVAGGVDTEVSIEEEVHLEARVDVGDILRFDVAGQPLSARVTSIRTVAWENSQNGGFVFVLRPGPWVERVPHNYAGFLQVRNDPVVRGTLQRELVAAHPNVSIIDVRDVLAAIKDIVDNVTFGITVVGGVTLAGGVLILVGAVAMTKFQKLYETAIYRTLGASTRLVAAMVAVEYGVMGLLAGTLGAIGAAGLSWALATYLFEIPWRTTPMVYGLGIAGAAVLVSAVGLLSSADVLLRKPLATLRGE